MRQLKFRIWSKKEKQFVYGELEQKMPFYFVCSSAFEDKYEDILIKELDLTEWQQAINLKDKNSKEIYEGDIRGAEWIVNNEKVKRYSVMEWSAENTCFFWKGDVFPDFVETEIIGNIYENPELLPVSS